MSDASELQAQQHNGGPYLPLSRTPFPTVTVDQSINNYSGEAAPPHSRFPLGGCGLNPALRSAGNPITAVYAISANRPGYSDYFVMSPPSSYRSPSWMSYPPEPEDLPRQWNDTPVRRTHTLHGVAPSVRFLPLDECVNVLLSSPDRTLAISRPSAEAPSPSGIQQDGGSTLLCCCCCRRLLLCDLVSELSNR